jgi:hypothetical protein
MTGTLTLDLGLDRPRALGDRDRRAPRPLAPVAAAGSGSGSARSLDDLISAAWQDLVAHHTVACPMCAGPMVPRYGSGARPVGGRCRRCGSTLG